MNSFSYIGYEFDPSESCESCLIDSTVTVINPVMVIVADLLQQLELSLPEVIRIPEITININGLDVTFPPTDIHREDIMAALLAGKVNTELVRIKECQILIC